MDFEPPTIPDLKDTHEEWQATDRRYFSEDSMAKLMGEHDNDGTTVSELSFRELIVTGDLLQISTTWWDFFLLLPAKRNRRTKVITHSGCLLPGELEEASRI